MISNRYFLTFILIAMATWSCHPKKSSGLKDESADKSRYFDFAPNAAGMRDLYLYMDVREGLKSDGDHDGDWHDGSPSDSYCHTNHKPLIYSDRNHSPTNNIISNIDMPLDAVKGDFHTIVRICAQAYDLAPPHAPIEGSFDITVHTQGRSSNPTPFKFTGLRGWSDVDVGGLQFDGAVDDLDVQIGNISPGTRVFIESLQIAVMWDRPPQVHLVTREETEALWDQLGTDRGKIQALRRLYRLMADQALDKWGKLEAVTQQANLILLEDEVIGPDGDQQARIELAKLCFCRTPAPGSDISLWNECRKGGLIDRISPQAMGKEMPQYYVFRAACVHNFNHASRTSYPRFSRAYSDLMQHPWVNDELNWQGGALHRVYAQTYSDSYNRTFGLYDPESALDSIDVALASPAVAGGNAGALYYMSWVTKVDIELGLLQENKTYNGKYILKADVVALINDTLEEINDRVVTQQIPYGDKTEFELAQKNLLKKYRDLTGKDWVSTI